MGRGRAKAKQTKVARELKYSSHETDFAALQRELSTDEGLPNGSGGGDEPHDDPYDDYDDYRR
ncbi:DUF3073 domain-containing protein [Streptomyces sp. ID05-26A]|nr:DUF3073 domain-containing protein [Streptomyces sp. ID05-26A]